MNFGICPLSSVPIRSTPADSSEMVSQLLFGEVFEILETKGVAWFKIRCQWDNYMGWTRANQVQLITPTEFQHLQKHFAYNLDLVHPIMAADHFIPITLGARLPDFDGMRLKLENVYYQFSGQAVFPNDIFPTSDFILKVARRYLFAPYLRGGRSPMGIDSSGFVQIAFLMAGIPLEREASQQVFSGEPVDFVEQAMPADLAFFENNRGRISHVGILMPEGTIIHAYGRVRIDKLDHYGIFDQQQQKYTHRLRVIKRLLPSLLPPGGEKKTTQTVRQQIELF